MKVFGLIGKQLLHSLSPNIHEYIFNNLNIDGKYNLFCVEDRYLPNIIQSLKVLGIQGVNVTIPYKEKIIEQLDFLSPEVQKIGAVNTILIRDDRALGYNTDYYGFGKMLSREDIVIKNNSFYVLGSGGASKSIVHYLRDNNAKSITVVTRDKKQIKSNYPDDIIVIDYNELFNLQEGYAVINTTPCGMYPNIDSIPIEENIIKKFNVAIDIVYNPEETLFLKKARELELKAISGLFMLVEQGVKAQEIWNNINITKEVSEEIYNNLRNILNK